MLASLAETVDRVNAIESLTGAIVTGAGRAFCSGRDLAELPGIKAAETARAIPQAGGHESAMFARIEVPTVAAVNGAAVGGGLGFVYQCDYVVASSTALLADGHLQAAMVPSVASWYVPRRVGPWAAMQFFIRQRVGAAEALELGLVDEVVEPDDLHRPPPAAGSNRSGPSRRSCSVT